MEQFLAITGRNMKIYLRDRGAVFFSLLSTFIVIGLMVFFLGDMNIEGILGILEEFPGRDVAEDEKNAKLLVLSWTSAGILAINAVTVTLAVFSGMIRQSKWTVKFDLYCTDESYYHCGWLYCSCLDMFCNSLCYNTCSDRNLCCDTGDASL